MGDATTGYKKASRDNKTLYNLPVHCLLQKDRDEEFRCVVASESMQRASARRHRRRRPQQIFCGHPCRKGAYPYFHAPYNAHNRSASPRRERCRLAWDQRMLACSQPRAPPVMPPTARAAAAAPHMRHTQACLPAAARQVHERNCGRRQAVPERVRAPGAFHHQDRAGGRAG
jgi:hypothetical protein